MNCKPGDLAIIVRDAFQVDLGKIVEVVRHHRLDAAAGLLWECRSESGLTGDKGTTKNAAIADTDLRPA